MKSIGKNIFTQHPNLLEAIEEVFVSSVKSRRDSEYTPFRRFPNVQHVRVEVSAKDMIFEAFGISKRKAGAKIHYQRYSGEFLNRILLHHIIRLKRQKSEAAYGRLVFFLIKRSNIFFLTALRHCFPKGHRDFPVYFILQAHKRFKRLAKEQSTDLKYKRVYIEKAGGTFRPLGVPKLEGRLYLHLINQFLVLRYDKLLPDNQHGFRPGRGTLSAGLEILKNIEASNIYEFDYKNFFGSISQRFIRYCLGTMDLPKEIRDFFSDLNKRQPELPKERKLDESGVERVSNGLPELPKLNFVVPERNLHAPGLRMQTVNDPNVENFFDFSRLRGYYESIDIKGVPQGAPTSPFLSILALKGATNADTIFPDCKFVRYADDGVLFTENPNVDLSMYEPHLRKAAGVQYNGDKSGGVKKDGKWLKPLKFLGLEYDGVTNTLRAKTRKGSELIFDKQTLISALSQQERKEEPIFGKLTKEQKHEINPINGITDLGYLNCSALAEELEAKTREKIQDLLFQMRKESCELLEKVILSKRVYDILSNAIYGYRYLERRVSKFSGQEFVTSHYTGFILSRLYIGSGNLGNYYQDFRLSYIKRSGCDEYIKGLGPQQRPLRERKNFKANSPIGRTQNGEGVMYKWEDPKYNNWELPKYQILKNLLAVKLNVFNSTTVALTTMFEMLKEAEKRKYKFKGGKNPLVISELLSRKEIPNQTSEYQNLNDQEFNYEKPGGETDPGYHA